MKKRMALAAFAAVLAWFPQSTQTVSAIYCYSGDPPAVYQACVAYNQGIGLQVNNQIKLNSIQHEINYSIAQITAIDEMVYSLNTQIAAQKALIAKTQAAIDDLNMRMRFAEAGLIRLQADVTVRDQLLNERLRYVDSHGAVNYIQLVLTSSSINQLLNRLVGAQEVAQSDRKLLTNLQQEHLQVAIASSVLDQQRTQVQNLLQQQKATEADLESNLKTQAAALAYQQQLQVALHAQLAEAQTERAAIDAQVAQLARQYDAAAIKAGGGSGVFEWPEPACNFGCISQGYGCSQLSIEQYDAACPWPHTIHTGIDIAGPFRTQIVAADTGVAYLGYCSVCGNYILMTHGNGYSTYYGHIDSFAPGLRSGQVVPRGTTIAFEGMTGWATGPHVHFEIRVNGVAKDPCIWLGC